MSTKETKNNNSQREQDREGDDEASEQQISCSQSLTEGDSNGNGNDARIEVGVALDRDSNTHNAGITQRRSFDDIACSLKQGNHALNTIDECQYEGEMDNKCKMEPFDGDDIVRSLPPERNSAIDRDVVDGEGLQKKGNYDEMYDKEKEDIFVENREDDGSEDMSASTTSAAGSIENERDIVGDIESNDQPDGGEERAPGIYPVEGRAPGNIPAWVRRRQTRRSRRSTTRASLGLSVNSVPSVVEATRVTDAEPVVYAQTVEPDELSKSQDFRRRTRIIMAVFILVIVSLVALLVGVLMTGSSESQPENPLCKLNDPLSQCRCKGSVDGNPKIEDICASGTFCSELRRFLIIEQYLEEDLSDPCSEQNMALLWLANEDKSTVDLSGPVEANEQLGQRYIMATFYFALSGDDWTISAAADENRTWLTPNHVCNWEGISCREKEVTYLYLWNTNLAGMIPKEIHLLDSLRILRLSQNRISGMWYDPSKVNNMTNYHLIDLSYNKITGDFLSGIHQIRDLGVLDITNNNITGSIPSEMGNMGSLRFIFLGGNNIKGTLPSELGQLKRLEKLTLEKNHLTGPIPSALGNLLSLEKLVLHNNLLDGTVPSQLGNLSVLEFLDVSYNRLTGTVPSAFGEMKKLGILDIRNNNLVGDIAYEICDLPYIELICIDDDQVLKNTNCPMPSCLVEGQEWSRLMPGM